MHKFKKSAASFTLNPIGVVRSELKIRNVASRQGTEGDPDAWIDPKPKLSRAFEGLSAGDEAIVITWLH